MQFILFDQHCKALLPLTFARPVSHLLIGIDLIIDKWERQLQSRPDVCTARHLKSLFPNGAVQEGMYINASVIPTPALVKRILELPKGDLLASQGKAVAMYCNAEQAAQIFQRVERMEHVNLDKMAANRYVFAEHVTFITRPADVFIENGSILTADYAAITGKRRTIDFPKGVTACGDDIYVEEGAILRPCILNSETGPIYISRGAEIMEGCMVRGPFFLGVGSSLKMGAKIYGPTSIGAHCRIGGEVNNSIVNEYSNKGHDGFLGNSVIGSWCNLGADTNISNLKNNYSQVKVWNYESSMIEDSGLQFHGLIMGDHSKAGINTMFNTGTVVGMCSNIYGSGFPQKFIPSFSWGNAEGFIDFDLDRAKEMARAMMNRRSVVFTDKDAALFEEVFDHDAHFRK